MYKINLLKAFKHRPVLQLAPWQFAASWLCQRSGVQLQWHRWGDPRHPPLLWMSNVAFPPGLNEWLSTGWNHEIYWTVGIYEIFASPHLFNLFIEEFYNSCVLKACAYCLSECLRCRRVGTEEVVGPMKPKCESFTPVYDCCNLGRHNLQELCQVTPLRKLFALTHHGRDRCQFLAP